VGTGEIPELNSRHPALLTTQVSPRVGLPASSAGRLKLSAAAAMLWTKDFFCWRDQSSSVNVAVSHGVGSTNVITYCTLYQHVPLNSQYLLLCCTCITWHCLMSHHLPWS